MALPGIEPRFPPRQRGVLAIGQQGHKLSIKLLNYKEQRLKSLLIIKSYEEAKGNKKILPILQQKNRS